MSLTCVLHAVIQIQCLILPLYNMQCLTLSLCRALCCPRFLTCSATYCFYVPPLCFSPSSISCLCYTQGLVLLLSAVSCFYYSHCLISLLAVLYASIAPSASCLLYFHAVPLTSILNYNTALLLYFFFSSCA